MRKLFLSILLASAASAPALATQDRVAEARPPSGDRQESHRDQARPDRQQSRGQAPAQRFGGERADQPLPQAGTSPSNPEHAQRAGGVSRWTRDNVQQAGETSRWTRDPNQQPGETSRWTRDRTAPSDDRPASTGGQRGGWTRSGDLRQSDRPIPNVMRSPSPLIVSDSPREGTQPALRADARRRTINWTTNWRSDRRYDWRNWRDRHRSTFHVGIYYDPFGWGYRPYQVGWRLWPSYYGRRYWIDDPYQYRLPYAPPGTVWVRYWDDALLIDTWTGEVVDVIQNFFW